MFTPKLQLRVTATLLNRSARARTSNPQKTTFAAFKPSLTLLDDRSVPAAAGAPDLAFGGTGLVQTDFQAGTDEAHAVTADAHGRYVVGFTSPETETEDGPPADAGGGGGGAKSRPRTR